MSVVASVYSEGTVGTGRSSRNRRESCAQETYHSLPGMACWCVHIPTLCPVSLCQSHLCKWPALVGSLCNLKSRILGLWEWTHSTPFPWFSHSVVSTFSQGHTDSVILLSYFVYLILWVWQLYTFCGGFSSFRPLSALYANCEDFGYDVVVLHFCRCGCVHVGKHPQFYLLWVCSTGGFCKTFCYRISWVLPWSKSLEFFGKHFLTVIWDQSTDQSCSL